MELGSKTTSLQYLGLVVALAVVIGMLGANAFMDAAGFDASWHRDGWPFLCGFVLFFLSFMLLRFLFQLGTQIVSRLGQMHERPGLPITITLLACGTLCVLGSLLLVWHGDSGSLNMSPTMNLPGNLPGANMATQFGMSVRNSGSLMRPLAVCAALVIGVALLALGVWSSLVPAAAANDDSLGTR
jgi:hypothetical protein